MRRLWIFFIIASLAPGATAAMALVDQKNMSVLATVQTPASVSVSANTLAFGTVIQSDANDHSGCTHGSTTIQVTATAGRTYTVKASPGQNSGGLSCNRLMRGLTDTTKYLSYVLFTDDIHFNQIDDGSGFCNPSPIIYTGDGSAQSITVYGGVPAQQYVANQDYSDLVTIIVEFN